MIDIDTVPAGTRQRKLAPDLNPGDWIYDPTGAPPVRVLAAIPWEHGVSLLLHSAAGGKPYLADTAPGQTFTLATDADLRAVKDRQRRAAIDAYLRELGNMLRALPLPLPADYWPVDVTVRVDTPEQVRRAAELLGVDVADGPRQVSAVWPAPPQEHPATVEVRWYAATDDGSYRRELDNGDDTLVLPAYVEGHPHGGRTGGAS